MYRRAHGALYVSGALIDASQLKIKAGEEGLASYQSSPGNWRRFCRRCAPQLLVVIEHIPGQLYYGAATLDAGAHLGHPGGRECHIHLSSKAPWGIGRRQVAVPQ